MPNIPMSSLNRSSFLFKGGIHVDSPPIFSSLMIRSLDGHKGSIGLILYPLHRTLWFSPPLNIVMDGSLQYAIFCPYFEFTLMRCTITKKLCGTKNLDHMPQNEHSLRMLCLAQQLLVWSYTNKATSIPSFKIRNYLMSFSSFRICIGRPPTLSLWRDSIGMYGHRY